VFTAAPDLGKRMGIRSHKQYAFWNGALPCKLLLIKVELDQFVTGQRAASTEPQPQQAPVEQARLSEGGQMFANRLQKNLRQLGKWARREGIECYRLYDADMPEYALAVDLYRDWVHVQEYAPPRSIDPDKAQARLLDALAAIPQALGIAREKVVVKRRERQSGTRQYERQASQGEFLEVSEGGVKLLVNLTDYLDTGLFLDHRPLRLRIQVRSFEAICRMIHTGMGIGVLPEQVVRNYLPALDVAMVPLTDVWARRELKLGVRNLESLSVTARQMLEHLTLREGQA